MTVKKDKKVLVLTTGGTIGSADSPAGTRPTTGVIDQVIARALKELHADGESLETETFSLMSKDSTNMTGRDQMKIASHAFHAPEKYSGIVITHGTDTLHFASSMLSLMLRDMRRPVVITGAMRTIDHPETDAITNMKGALRFAIEDVGGVFVAFNNKIMHGPTVYEIKPGDIDGFISVTEPVAFVKKNNIVYNEAGRQVPTPRDAPTLNLKQDPKVDIIGLTPITTFDQIEHRAKINNGIVIISPSLGIPKSMLSGIKRLASEKPVVITAEHKEPFLRTSTYEVAKAVEGSEIISGVGLYPFDYSNLVFTLGQLRKPDKTVSNVRRMFIGNVVRVNTRL